MNDGFPKWVFEALEAIARRCGSRSRRRAARRVSQDRTVEAFHAIEIAGTGTVHVTQGSATSVRVEAEPSVIEKVTTRVNDGRLVIDTPGATYCGLFSSLARRPRPEVDVHVSLPALDSLEISGAGEFLGAGPIRTEDLLCVITGAGSIELSGTAVRQRVRLEGTGNVRNFLLASSECSVDLSGMGECQINVSRELVANLSGMGSIVYAGHPAVRQASSGVGTVRPR